jgi:hypothetical protein
VGFAPGGDSKNLAEGVACHIFLRISKSGTVSLEFQGTGVFSCHSEEAEGD